MTLDNPTWNGVAVSPRATGQTPLTRERIVRAALELVDAAGLEGLSMRRLGAELGVDASTIYYHVPNKSALYDLVMDAVMSEMSMAWAEDEAPAARERTLAGARAYREALLAHPRALPLLAGRPLRTEVSLRPVELLLGVLADAGLAYPAALAAVNAIAHYTVGAALTYAAHLFEGEYQEEFDKNWFAALPEERFPHVRAALAGGGLLEPAEEVDAGLEALIDGLLARPGTTGRRRRS
jgi:TetR/AcrR family transcriptional regulator, tetracycline repressor protein